MFVVYLYTQNQKCKLISLHFWSVCFARCAKVFMFILASTSSNISPLFKLKISLPQRSYASNIIPSDWNSNLPIKHVLPKKTENGNGAFSRNTRNVGIKCDPILCLVKFLRDIQWSILPPKNPWLRLPKSHVSKSHTVGGSFSTHWKPWVSPRSFTEAKVTFIASGCKATHTKLWWILSKESMIFQQITLLHGYVTNALSFNRKKTTQRAGEVSWWNG